ncbi:MAG: hypothetical protein K2X86_08880 [Cytophagaceae bacterium]|nr:hypothetical protein [Cytophagaceae bacterium]
MRQGEILGNALDGLFNLNIKYTVDKFIVSHVQKIVYVDFHTNIDSERFEREEEFSLDDFKAWMEINQKEFLTHYVTSDVDDQGEGEYRDVKATNWFAALENTCKWQVECFVNYYLNK